MERTRQVQCSASEPVRYDGDDETDKIVALAGLGPLAEYTDRLGVTGGFAGAVPYLGPGIPVVDRGGLLVHGLLMLNAGGDCCTDLAMVQAAEGVLGDVGSDTTFRRMIADFAKTPGSTGAIDDVMAEVRTRVWAEHCWSDPGRRVTLDIDATLTRVHSEKEDAKGNYKRGYGFHPLCGFVDHGQATPARTPSPISLGSSTQDWTRSPKASPGPIAPALSLLTRPTKSSSDPIRPGTPSGSCGTCGTATSGSVSPEGRTPS